MQMIDNKKNPEKNQTDTQTPGKVPEKQTPTPETEQPRRYDEADPNWRNPDVQMNPNINSSHRI